MKKKQKNKTNTKLNSFFDPSERGKKKKPDLSVDAFRLPSLTEEEWGQAEEAHQDTHTLLHLCGAKAYG